jgi:hypothetical protein
MKFGLIIKVLIGLMCASALYAFICSILQDRKANRLSEWVQKHYPDIWKSLPWIFRKLIKRDAALRRINHFNLIRDKVFEENYAAVRYYDRHILLSIFAGLAFLGIAVLLGYVKELK